MKSKILLFSSLFATILCGCNSLDSSILTEESDSTKDSETLESSSVEESVKKEKVFSYDKERYLDNSNDVYRVNINTQNNVFPWSTSTYVEGEASITSQDGTITSLESKSLGVRLRGNSTSAPEKKSFKLKFDKKQSLFGLPANKKWCLLANYFDKSNIRNYLAYTLARNIFDDFQPESIFVDVYFNGDYQGLYLLTEQIEANEGRVDIKNKTNIDGISSFLIEVDARAQSEYPSYENTFWWSDSNYMYKVKYPDEDDYIDAINAQNTSLVEKFNTNYSWAKNFISNTFIDIENKTPENSMDLESLAKEYLVQEYFKNVDYGCTSEFFYIDQSDETPKLKAGPVWDFDIACGMIESNNEAYASYFTSNLYIKNADAYSRKLLEIPSFKDLVKQIYTENRELFVKTIDEIAVIRNVLFDAQSRNKKKWNFPTSLVYWIEQYCYGNKYAQLVSVAEHYDRVKETLEKQLKKLDKAYLINE